MSVPMLKSSILQHAILKLRYNIYHVLTVKLKVGGFQMRQQLQTIYKYDELSDRAQQKALDNYCSDGMYDSKENEDTLKAFEQLFPVNIKNWEYDQWRGNVSFSFTADDDIENLSGIRLLAYLYNNYFRDLFKGKYYSKGRYVNGTYYNKSRHSKVIFEHSCVLTGYCIDDDTLKPIYDFLKKPSQHVTFHELMNDCLQSWAVAASNDMENYYSEESFRDGCEANEWEFSEDGSMI